MCGKISAITVKEFVEKLIAGGGENPLPAVCMEYGLQRGFLEQQDVMNPEQPLVRKHAARIIHNFLRMELKEADEIDGSPAYILQDLFDCRVCAGHIIQVYVKGIMDDRSVSDGRRIFDGEGVVLPTEAEEILSRIFQEKARIPRKETDVSDRIAKEPVEITSEQAVQLLRESDNVRLVDVRTEREYEQSHMKDAINVPLLSVIKNPFVFSEDRNTLLLLYCTNGYQSRVAAQCLLEAGYQKVAYFAWTTAFLFTK